MADDELSVTFAALADPTRRAILARLATGEATVNELAEPFAMSLQAVSKHLKVLEHARLISRGRNAQYRPCRLEAQQLDDAIDWIEHNKEVWEDRFDRLEQHLRDIRRPDSTTVEDPKTKKTKTDSPKTDSPKTKKESTR
jgi:DNA-binding transcriptional ArsR family regulator